MLLSHDRKMLAAKGAGIALIVGAGIGLFMRPDIASGQFQLGSRSDFSFTRAAPGAPGSAAGGRGLVILASAPMPTMATPKPRVTTAAPAEPVADQTLASAQSDVVDNDAAAPAAGADSAEAHAASAPDDDAVPAPPEARPDSAPTAQDDGA